MERCAKSKVLSKTKVVIPVIDGFVPAEALQDHLENVPPGIRLWWKWNKNRENFAAQHLGKNYLAKPAKKIACFLQKPEENYASHSFRRSGATAMVEGGG